MAFFFLLCPGEYCKSGPSTKSHPFRLQDVTFYIGEANYNAATAPLNWILQADDVALYFTTQKNGVRGEAISHGASGHATPRVRFTSSVAVSYTYDHLLPPQTLPSALSWNDTAGAWCPAPPSRPRYALPPPILGTPLASSPATSLPGPYGPSFLERWIAPPSSSSAGGVPTRSFATCMSQRGQSCYAT
jgi:hypothetical protein